MGRKEIVQGVLDQTSQEVALLGSAERKRALIILRQAEEELSGELGRWLAGQDANEIFTARKRTELLSQIGDMRQRLGEVGPATLKALGETSNAAGVLAASHAKFTTEVLTDAFTGVSSPINLDVSLILSKSDSMLLKRHRKSAIKYSRETREWIGRQIGVGVLKQESFDQMTSRIARLSRQPIADFAGRSGQMANGLFNAPRNNINRLVRTEAIHAYNTHHQEAIRELGLQKRWDSSLDRRGCVVCRDLDGETVPNDKLFPGGFDHPPAHPFCRCTVVAWDPDWDHPSLPSEGTESIEPPNLGGTLT